MRDLASAILGDNVMFGSETNPEGLVNIGTAENYSMLDEVANFIKLHDLGFKGVDFNYGEGPWGSTRLRKAMAKYINKHFHSYVPVEADDLLSASGCTSMFNMLGLTLGDPGDGILLSRPSYTAFPTDFGLMAKIKPVFVSSNGVDQFSPEVAHTYEDALEKAKKDGIRIRALMLCNPHNPLGQCYPKDTIIALMRFCNEHQIHMLADEVYAQSVYETPNKAATQFVSILSFDSSEYIDPNYLHFLYGMSKDLACGGLRLGVLHTRNKELMRAMSSITQFHWAGMADERIAIMMLEDEQWIKKFLETSRQKLAASSRLVRQLMDDAGIRYSHNSNAGFFLWVDLSPWLKEKDGEDGWKMEEVLTRKMLNNKVFILNGGAQAAEEPGFFRLVFSHDEKTLRKGFERLLKTLKEQE
ncbi:1-aminocyclopropane-1-carboxylate synthase 1 [Glonium stellatum]|uniref:1-aminocyclopropane-1-carboxylate synthase 1 n=1 Tax=Glonium stellatum TaxID=574774 RepID=A0A8E2JXZ0_9PEZI|nr:1-aminocyclopropane-1-carboxylate synthase 1 [Glonium stellatum]